MKQPGTARRGTAHWRTMLLTALTLFGTQCIAQGGAAFPNKPIRMLVGFTAGSELDVIGRLLGQEMSDKWGQRIVVDNRPGAGGTVAGGIAATAVPDGYTLVFISVSHAASQGLYPKLAYHTLRDFSPISQATSAPNVLLVAPVIGVKTAKDLIAMVRAKPGQINFGSAGVGSGTHMAGEMFRFGASLNVSHVPYKGVPEVLGDTMSGRIHYSFAPIGNALPLVKDRRLVALGVTTLARSPSLPDVPTLHETVIPGLDWDQWYGMLAPAKTPAPIVNQIAQEMARVLSLPDIRQRLAARGSVAKPSTPAEFGKFLRAEVDKITKVIKDGGIKID